MGKLVKRCLLVLGIIMLVIPPFYKKISKNEWNGQSIGMIRIPMIHLELPIYEGTEEEILQHGIGYLNKSSFPGSGIGSHCLLAGHRGLPNAEMFERLGEMKIGDFFYLEIDETTYRYRVCEIKTIRPEQTKMLGAQEGRELVSLITCTPYGINTHRLIVTGERMDED